MSRASKRPDGLRSQMGQYAMVPMWLVRRCDNLRALQLYIWLSGKYARHDDQVAWPTNDALAKAMGTSLATVERAIADLRLAGGITTTRRHRADGSVAGLDYVIIQVEPEPNQTIKSEGKDQTITCAGLDSDQTIKTDGPPPSNLRGLYRDPDPVNQIQELLEQQPLDQSTGAAAADEPADRPPGVVGGYEFDPLKPPDAFALHWNRLVADSPLARVQFLNAPRRRLIRCRLVEAPWAVQQQAIRKLLASDHCTNRNGKGFVASFDWYISSDGPRIKALEGVYDNAPDRRQTPLQARLDAVATGGDVWSQVLRELEAVVPRWDFGQWWAATTLVEDAGSRLVVAADAVAIEWIERHYVAELAIALAAVRPEAGVAWQDARAVRSA